jgi:hypothetical protein
MNEQMIARLKELARSNCFHDDKDEDVIVDDYAGGNIDDAFDLGERAGETMLARDVLLAMNIMWTEE